MFNMVMVARGTETASQRCSVKKVVLKDFAKFTGKHLYFRPQAYKFLQKETLAEVFYCEFCEIFKNPFLYRTALVATIKNSEFKKSLVESMVFCSIFQAESLKI